MRLTEQTRDTVTEAEAYHRKYCGTEPEPPSSLEKGRVHYDAEGEGDDDADEGTDDANLMVQKRRKVME